MGYSFHKLRGRRTLFIGEVNTGKSSLMSSLIEESIADDPLLEAEKKRQRQRGVQDLTKGKIAVIDLGPDFVLPSGKKLGAKLQHSDWILGKVQYYAPKKLYAPRAIGRTREEIISLAKSNHASIDRLLDSVMGKNYPTVFVNDVTLYFQWGNASRMIQLSRESTTFIANGYKGKSLLEDKGSGISQNETTELERFSSEMNSVINIGRK